MSDDLVKRLRQCSVTKRDQSIKIMDDAADRISALEAALAEMTRRRDEWRKKAEGYDAVRLALREKVGTPWPPNMSRLLWAGIAADEKKRADDAEAALAKADELARAARSGMPPAGEPITSQADLDGYRALTAYRQARDATR